MKRITFTFLALVMAWYMGGCGGSSSNLTQNQNSSPAGSGGARAGSGGAIGSGGLTGTGGNRVSGSGGVVGTGGITGGSGGSSVGSGGNTGSGGATIPPSAPDVNGTDTPTGGASGDLSPTAHYYIFAYDGQFLGMINSNRFDQYSICNSFGSYGSRFSSTSIWNQFSSYGSNFASNSAFNSFSSHPPVIYQDDTVILYLTTNTIKTPRIDPNDLLTLLQDDGCDISR